ncbi:MAG: hypothetical protein ACRDEA_13285, partial [Microcystaceae cyanobacterium]
RTDRCGLELGRSLVVDYEFLVLNGEPVRWAASLCLLQLALAQRDRRSSPIAVRRGVSHRVSE